MILRDADSVFNISLLRKILFASSILSIAIASLLKEEMI